MRSKFTHELINFDKKNQKSSNFYLYLLGKKRYHFIFFLPCRIMLSDANKTEAKCCSGLCIDLLTKVEEELGFTYELVRTPDPKWGTFEVRPLTIVVFVKKKSVFSKVFELDYRALCTVSAWFLEWSNGRISEQKNRSGAFGLKNQCGERGCRGFYYAVFRVRHCHHCGQEDGDHLADGLPG